VLSSPSGGGSESDVQCFVGPGANRNNQGHTYRTLPPCGPVHYTRSLLQSNYPILTSWTDVGVLNSEVVGWQPGWGSYSWMKRIDPRHSCAWLPRLGAKQLLVITILVYNSLTVHLDESRTLRHLCSGFGGWR
jgi:hypothetical protein